MPGNNTCPSCGAVASSKDPFCPSCGSEIAGTKRGADETLVNPQADHAACLSCGSPLTGSTNFCPKCGAGRSDDATVTSQGSIERITTERLASATSGEFEILERLGYGAMGSVYLARDVALSRRVAIKVISPHLLEDESAISRFRLEAQTVAALRHPNIVNLYGVRQFGDVHYFIMDFIEGPSLRSMMKVHAPLEIPVAQALLFQVGGALSYAHRRGRGVIHRDIKPANIMVDREGHAVVMDFGISRVGEGRSGLTQTGATIGTPEYMSPEQCMDQELTGASDQYALGIVAYEMLTGSVPFRGSTYAMMMSHASSPPPPIKVMRPDCPPEVEAAIMRMLSKAPAERFSDVDAAVKALGGKPLSPGDAILDRIVELVESVSSDLAALDDSSPLSPVPGSPDRATIAIIGVPDIVEPGDRFDLHAESRQGGGPAREAGDVAWSTSDPAVAAVEDGTVVAQAPGSVSLTATVGAVASTVILSVRERRSAAVSVRPQTVLIEPGGTIPLEADVLDRKGDPVAAALVWRTDDASVALIAQDGTLTAVAQGSTTIVVDADGATASAEIEVQQAAVHEVSMGEAPDTIQVGDEIALEVIVTDSQGAALKRTVAWHSDQPKVVAIREGRPVAVATGTATLSAECAGRSATVQVKVEPAGVASVVISGLPESSRPGEGFALQAVLLDQGGKPLIREVEWSSGDPSMASVSDAGLVRVHSEGRVALTARSGDVTETVTLVSSGTAMAGGPSTAEQTVALPASAAASATTGSLGEAPHQSKRRWAPWVGIAAIIAGALGLVQVLGSDRDVPVGGEEAPVPAQVVDTETADPAQEPATEGVEDPAEEVGVPATQEGQPEARPPEPRPSAPQAVAPAVDETAVASLRIEGGDQVLEAGALEVLTATAMNVTGVRVEAPSLLWRSSDETVAAVRDGEVTARGPGLATITASAAGIEGSIEVTVEAPALEPPTREEALEQVQRFVNLLRTGDTEAVARLFGRGGGQAGSGEFMARMREANFTARLVELGQPVLTANGAGVGFDIELVWRTPRGAQNQRRVPFLAALRPTPEGWRLAGVAMRPGAERIRGGGAPS